MSFSRTFEHREALLSAALQEFSARGYENASLNAILSAAGMSKGQLYHHFGSKEGLYLALIGELIQRKRAHFQANPLPMGADIFETLRGQLLAGRAFAQANPDIEAFSASFLRERGTAIYTRALEHHSFSADAGLQGLVAWAHARGDFRADVSLPSAQRLIAVFFSHIAEAADLQAPGDVVARVEEIVAFLRRGLGR